ncbi:hypothetical protein ZWY2020_052541 [Hordeum vulgare]|nr:hypothetical protein ZWY2020_052541 [Hordeum vulgare]
MMSITSTVGTPLCPPPVSTGGRRRGRCAVRAQAAGDGGAADSSEQKSVEIMCKFLEQCARHSSTFFCSVKSVTTVVMKVRPFPLSLSFPCCWSLAAASTPSSSSTSCCKCQLIKKKKPLFCTGLLTTRINSKLLSAPAGITTTRPPRWPKASGTARASPCEKGQLDFPERKSLHL